MRKKWLLWMAVLCFLMLPFLSSCGTTAQERIAQLNVWVATVQEVSEQADEQIPLLEQTIAEGELLLQDPLLTFDKKQEILGALATVKLKLVKAQEVKAQADTALAEWKVEINRLVEEGDIDIGKELELYGKGITATGTQLPPNVGVWVTLSGSVLTLLGGLFGAKVQKKSSETRIQAEKADFSTLVASVTAGLNAVNTDEAEKMKKAMSVIQQAKVGLQAKVKEAINS